MLSPERDDVLEINQSREAELGSQWGQTKETENSPGCQDKFDTEAKEKQKVSSVTYVLEVLESRTKSQVGQGSLMEDYKTGNGAVD